MQNILIILCKSLKQNKFVISNPRVEFDSDFKDLDGKTAHTGKSFRNLIESTRNQIVFTIFQLIWNQTDVQLVPNQSENGKYNMIFGLIQ